MVSAPSVVQDWGQWDEGMWEGAALASRNLIPAFLGAGTGKDLLQGEGESQVKSRNEEILFCSFTFTGRGG